MSYAVLRANGDLIWFDAITQFSERYTGTLTAHPLERGGVVNDHTTINNIEINLAGIISDADFNLTRPTITDDDATNWKINNKQFVNNSPVDSVVTIDYKPGINQFLPESISQFITPPVPVVNVPDFDRPKFAARIKDELTFMQRSAENFSLVDFVNGRIWRVIDNCVLVSLDFTETPESGDAIYPIMQIHVARYVDTRMVKLAIRNKGRKTTKAVVRPETKGDDATTEGTTFTGKSQAASAMDRFEGLSDPQNTVPQSE